MKSLLSFPLAILVALFLTYAPKTDAQTSPFRNGGFENGGANSVPDWSPFDGGYDVDRDTKHNGDLAIRFDNAVATLIKGASQKVVLNQSSATPIQISGWSKAERVEGNKNSDYSLYADLTYTDGTTLWGEHTDFRTGTHDWERRRFVIFPQKPVRELTLYVLFRRHRGTAWFDDVSLRELRGTRFDGQPLTFPVHKTSSGEPTKTVSAKDGLALGFDTGGGIERVTGGGEKITGNTGGGFFLRDVKNDGEIVPLRGKLTARANGGVDLSGGASGIRYNLRVEPHGDALSLDAELIETTKTERALTLYFALPVNAIGGAWGDDIRTSRKITAGNEYTNQTRVSVGATGGASLYPFCAVSRDKIGVGIASQMEWASTYRLFYHADTQLLVIAWDVALTAKTATWPPYNARARATVFRLAPDLAKWGFRAAASRFYSLNPNGYARRATKDGIWMPFTDPAKISHPEDFGIAYHEGDNSVKTDDALGILSFRYTEPASYWLPLPADLPRTYETVVNLLNERAKTATEGAKMARAVLNSGIKDENGRLSIDFRKEPRNDGALLLLNPNPELPASDEQPTKGWLVYNLADAVKRYADRTQTLDGEYLDSLEQWGDTLDFRPEHLKTCPYPIPFETDTYAPCVPEWYNVHTFTRFLRDDLRNRNKLLFANTTPVRYNAFSALLDVMGTEVTWLDAAGKFAPDPDSVMNLRRTLSAKKPYLLLMNADFDKFGHDEMEKYFETCLFYGIFPSCFSPDTANRVFWENPAWFERQRFVFKQYIPQIKELSAAGWEPITLAVSENPAIGVERYGTKFLTVHNLGTKPVTGNITTNLNGKKRWTVTLRVGETQVLPIRDAN